MQLVRDLPNRPGATRDPKDDMIIACILTPRAFLTMLDELPP